LVETAVPKVHLSIAPKLQLPDLPCDRRVDPSGRQPMQKSHESTVRATARLAVRDRLRRCDRFNPPFTKFTQELVGINEEGILLENAADDNHGMGAHGVNHDIATEFGEIVGAYDRIFRERLHMVDPGFELQ
jgi:hypothetical protein